MALAVLALIASFMAGYYWFQYTDILNRLGGVPIYISIGVDYGNQTRTWYNETKALTGMTLFRVTRNTANLTYGTGGYVQSINGLSYNATHAWFWGKWDTYESNWTLINIGADSYSVADNETFFWYFGISSWPPPLPR